jgi:hypothetical protein
MPHDIFLRKPRKFTHVSPLGGPTNFVQIGGNLFDVRRHSRSVFRDNESYYPVGNVSIMAPLGAKAEGASGDLNAPDETPSTAPKGRGANRGADAPRMREQGSLAPLERARALRVPAGTLATRKKLSTILNGGALCPLE